VSVCVALVVQHAMRIRHIIICGLHQFYSIFPHLFISGTIFEKQKLLNTKRVFDKKNAYWPSCKEPIIFVRF